MILSALVLCCLVKILCRKGKADRSALLTSLCCPGLCNFDIILKYRVSKPSIALVQNVFRISGSISPWKVNICIKLKSLDQILLKDMSAFWSVHLSLNCLLVKISPQHNSTSTMLRYWLAVEWLTEDWLLSGCSAGNTWLMKCCWDGCLYCQFSTQDI